MNYLDQHKTIIEQPIALAIEANHNDIAKPTFINLFVYFVMFLIRAFSNINPNSAKSSNPARKLKMQLLVFYSIPAFFVFGTSAVILLGMYLCIFELALTLAQRTTI